MKISNLISYEDVRTYFLSNPNETLSLKQEVSIRYKNSDYNYWDNKKFINWFIKDSSVYDYQGFIQISNKLRKKFSDIITMNGKHYLRVNVFTDSESNLKLTQIIFDNHVKFFTSIEDSVKEIEMFGQVLSKYSGFTHRCKVKEDSLLKQYIPTVSDFCGNFIIDGKECCHMDISKAVYNINIWTIYLSGNDDSSYSKNYLQEDDMIKDRDFILNSDSLDISNIKDLYFSN